MSNTVRFYDYKKDNDQTLLILDTLQDMAENVLWADPNLNAPDNAARFDALHDAKEAIKRKFLMGLD